MESVPRSAGPGSGEEGRARGSRGHWVGSLLEWAHRMIRTGRRRVWENRRGVPLLPRVPTPGHISWSLTGLAKEEEGEPWGS